MRGKDVTLCSVPACKAQPVRALYRLHSWTLPVDRKLAIYRSITANGHHCTGTKTMSLNWCPGTINNVSVTVKLCKNIHRPPLWSSGQSSWLQIQSSGFGSRHYQIFWKVAGLERGPLSLLNTIEGRKSSGSGIESRLSAKLVPSFADLPRGQCDGSLRPYSRFFRRDPLFFLPSSSSVVLTRLSGPRSRPTISEKMW
jgi:hypothetical protein